MNRIVAEVEARTGLLVLGRLSGGEQDGAFLLDAGDGVRRVLKLQPDPVKAKRLLRARSVVDHAVRGGWSAAAWLQTGTLEDGTAFLIQEYVQGRPITTLDTETVRAILDANSQQSDLALAEAADDSEQLNSVVFGDHPWKAAVRNRSPAGAALVRHGDKIRPAGHVRLPVSDVVHGDYSSSNMIVTGDGAVRFIDCETVGRGTRVRDLTDLHRQCFVHPGASPAAMQLLHDTAMAIAGSAVFRVCTIGVSYNNLAWWAEHRTAAEFDEACRRVSTLFSSLTRSAA